MLEGISWITLNENLCHTMLLFLFRIFSVLERIKLSGLLTCSLLSRPGLVLDSAAYNNSSCGLWLLRSRSCQDSCGISSMRLVQIMYVLNQLLGPFPMRKLLSTHSHLIVLLFVRDTSETICLFD